MLRRVWMGLRATLPIALSIIPFGIAYGAVANQSMAPWQAQLMSVTVFAGTAQFVSASMLAEGGALLPILITGVLINMRLLLMSAALTPHVGKGPRRRHLLLAHLLTDESFAVSMAHFEREGGDPLFYIGSGLAIFGTWQIATLVGLLFGARIPAGLGLEYALPASLICLLFLLVRDRYAAGAAILAAAVALAARPLVTSTWSTMVATILAATLGVLVKRWRSPS